MRLHPPPHLICLPAFPATAHVAPSRHPRPFREQPRQRSGCRAVCGVRWGQLEQRGQRSTVAGPCLARRDGSGACVCAHRPAGAGPAAARSRTAACSSRWQRCPACCPGQGRCRCSRVARRARDVFLPFQPFPRCRGCSRPGLQCILTVFHTSCAKLPVFLREIPGLM